MHNMHIFKIRIFVYSLTLGDLTSSSLVLIINKNKQSFSVETQKFLTRLRGQRVARRVV